MKKLFSKFYSNLKGRGLFFQITLANVLIIAAAMIIVASIMISSFSGVALEKETLLGKEAVRKIQSFTEEKYNRAYNLSNYMHTNGNVGDSFADILANPEYAYDYDVIRFIDNYLLSVSSSEPDISEYILVTANGNVYASPTREGRTVSPSFDYFSYAPVRELIAGEDAMLITHDAAPAYMSNAAPVVSFVGKIFDPAYFPAKKLVGISIMNVPLEAFETSYQEHASLLKGDLYLVSRGNEILFSSHPGDDGQSFTEPDHSGRNVTVNEAKVGLSGIRVVNVVSDDMLFSDISQLQFQMTVVLIVCVAVLTVLVFLLLKVYNKKITDIALKMQAIRGGDLSVRLPVVSGDEIGILSSSFNDMCAQLDDYIKRNYDAQMRLRTSELNALQAQINPHFLFNTIESIRMKAANDGNPELAQMLALLGNMFRWSIRFNEKIVSIEDEVDYISSYLQLQRFRFNDRIGIEVRVPDELLDYGIPKLILQPIVENAIMHGLSDSTDPGLVTIQAQPCGPDLVIRVSDDGAGMDAAELDRLRRSIAGEGDWTGSYGIGLRNVHERIQLLFGSGYGLTVESQRGRGTTVAVRIPRMTKEEMQERV